MTRPKDIITPEICQRFITLPDERLIVGKRQHWFAVMPALTVMILLELGLIILGTVAFLEGAFDPTFFIISLALFVSAGISVGAKIVADWYYHLYIVTTKRILEVNCAPLFSHSIDDVALDQVRITEIRVDIKGFVNELLDKGDVVIAFDRPSHEETMVIAEIQDPTTTGAVLANSIKLMMQSSPVWFQPRTPVADYYKFTDDVVAIHTSSARKA